MFNLTSRSDNKSLSEFVDPFNKDGVDYISIQLCKRKSMFRDNKLHKATVYLKNGNTSGEQEFYDDDVNNLFIRIQSFINKL